MKRFAILAISLFVFGSLFAQIDTKAKSILDKASANLKKNETIKIDFTLTLEDTKTGKKEVIKGDVVSKNNKFKITTPAVQTYFDGKDQYVYTLKNKEVSISTPTKDELQEINPALILSSYAKNSKIEFSLDNKESLPHHVIDISPDLKLKKPYYKTVVKIDKKTLQLISIKVLSQNGVQTLFAVNKIDTGVKYDDNFFTFDSKANPNVEINDLR